MLNPKIPSKPVGKVIGIQCGMTPRDSEFKNAITNFGGELINIDNIDDKNDNSLRKIRAKLCQSVGTGKFQRNLLFEYPFREFVNVAIIVMRAI